MTYQEQQEQDQDQGEQHQFQGQEQEQQEGQQEGQEGQQEQEQEQSEKIQHEPDKDHPRFRQVYAKLKQSERKLEEFEQREIAREAELQSIKESLKANKIVDLQEQYKGAIEAGDVQEQVRIQTEIMRQFSAETKEHAKQEPKNSAPGLSIEDQAAIHTFTTNNKWYHQNDALAGAFDSIHRRVIGSDEYMYMPVQEQLSESLRRLKQSFPNHFRQSSPPPPGNRASQAPASATGKQKDKLSPEQKQAAYIMFSGYTTADAEKLYLEAITEG